jgi:hypothetical protein
MSPRVLVLDPALNLQWAARLHVPSCEAIHRGEERGALVYRDPDECDAELAVLRDAGYEIDPCPCMEERP